MDTRTGKKIRLGRLFDQSSRNSLIIAYSHGVFSGPLPGLRSLDEVKTNVQAMRAARGMIISPGMVDKLEDYFIGKDKPSLLIHMDWKTAGRKVLPSRQTALTPLAEVEQLVSAGADGLMTYLYYGQDDVNLELAEIERNASIARACEKYGLALIIEPRSACEAEKPESIHGAALATYARIGAEIGADIIKSVAPPQLEELEEVVTTCPVPVMVAGGPGGADARSVLELAKGIMDSGARGLVFGRKVYQHDNPNGLMKALGKVVYDGATVEDSLAELR